MPLWAVLVWLVVWQLAAWWVDAPILLASPVAALKRLSQLAFEAAFWRAVGFSLGRILLGFALSALLGVDGSLNYGGITDESYLTYINAYLAAGNLDRSAACSEMLMYIASNTPIVTVCFERHVVITHRYVTTGIEVTGSNVFYNIPEWEIHISDEEEQT